MADELSSDRGRWRVFGEREIHRDPDVWFGQVDVEVPDRRRIWYGVVRLHRSALMALVDEAGRVLLVWRHRFIQDRWGWELPGGLVDEDEEPAAAAMRELEDQTGYRAGRVERLVSFQPVADRVDAGQWVFAGHDPVRAGEPVTPQAARMEWVPLASVLGLIDAGEIWNGATVAGLLRLLAGGAPASPGD